MVLFPNAKINIGLYVTSTLPNGYHTLETAMVPIGWRDILEIIPASDDITTLTITGRNVNCPIEKNLVYRAWNLLHEEFDIPFVNIFLHKVIPDGAGLGGGSSDAAFTLKGLNEIFSIGLDEDDLCRLALKLGADCPFFIHNRPMIAKGIGEQLSPLDFKPFDGYIAVVRPLRAVSTAEAYRYVTIESPSSPLSSMLSGDVSSWKESNVKNMFEESVAINVPGVLDIKSRLYDLGALYSSMSGSGSAVFGLFENAKMAHLIEKSFPDCICYFGPFSFESR